MNDLLCLRLGITNSYLIKSGSGYIMVDAGSLRKEKLFQSLLTKNGIHPQDIKLIIITHAHYDHIGSLAGIKKACGCPVLAHPLEAEIIRQGEVAIPPGTNILGTAVSSIGKRSRRLLAFKPLDCEMLVKEEYDLAKFDVKGRILSTPGHTPGSISLLMDNGNAFVGDLAVNWTGFNIYPPFAEMPEEIYRSWSLLVSQGAENIFPAHGRPFSINRIKKELKSKARLSFGIA